MPTPPSRRCVDPEPSNRSGAAIGVARHRQARRGLSALMACTSLLSVQAAVAQAATLPAAPAQAVATRSPVGTAVAGIIGYTRWPDETLPLRLCTLGHSPGIDELLQGVELGSPQRPVSVRASSGVADALKDCHAIYVGPGDAALWRVLLQGAIGRPVLLLGEGAAFCTDGGMFCLEPNTPAVKFNANLDAIARSGLRVNPLVLRIARNPAGGGT